MIMSLRNGIYCEEQDGDMDFVDQVMRKHPVDVFYDDGPGQSVTYWMFRNTVDIRTYSECSEPSWIFRTILVNVENGSGYSAPSQMTKTTANNQSHIKCLEPPKIFENYSG